MIKTIIIILIVILVFSYLKFKHNYRLSLRFVKFMEQKWMLSNNDIAARLSLCSACTDAQLYETAANIYNDIIQTPELKCQLSEEQIEYVYMNRRFCDAPLLWSSGAKNHVAFRYIHYFFLKRIGRRRFSFIREEDLLEFNSFLRYKNDR